MYKKQGIQNDALVCFIKFKLKYLKLIIFKHIYGLILFFIENIELHRFINKFIKNKIERSLYDFHTKKELISIQLLSEIFLQVK